jgi:DNA-directed RNA polymerase subunit RPC12/RpoP
MRVVGYKCPDCGKEFDEYFQWSEKPPEELDAPLCDCGAKYAKFNFKNNCHRVYENDGGID